STPASTWSHLMLTPVAAMTFFTTWQISGPVPSPGISVTSCTISGSPYRRKKERQSEGLSVSAGIIPSKTGVVQHPFALLSLGDHEKVETVSFRALFFERARRRE